MKKNNFTTNKQSPLERVHIDGFLLLSLLCLMFVGLLTIYSSGGQDWDLVYRQLIRLGIGITIMVGLAQLPILLYQRVSIYFYIAGILMLVGVLLFGVVGKGAQRWLDLGVFRFQPSEIMKLAMPMMIAWYISHSSIPARHRDIFVGFFLVFLPYLLPSNPI
jgi:rod shape determining protein RodA